jgi:MYXO-CTERM domain-containing protein
MRLSTGCIVLATLSLSAASHAQVMAGGPYLLKQGTSCLDGGPTVGQNTSLDSCSVSAASSDRAWYLEDRGGGSFGLRNAGNGGYLDVSGASAAIGAPLITWQGNAQPNQSFAFVARGAGYELHPQHATGQCATAGAGGAVTLGACDAGNAGQTWQLESATTVDSARTCSAGELYRPAFVENTQGGPAGANVAIVSHGFFMVLFAPDSGAPPGILHVYDFSNPRNAILKARYDDAHTARFREAHSMPIGIIDGTEYVAIQTIDGIQFWDITDPVNATHVSSLDLPGVRGGDYENVAWQADWQGRTLFVTGGNQGLYVIDAADPRQPEPSRQVPTGQMGGFRVGPLFARGSMLVISNMDQNGAYSVLDITDPTEPTLLATKGGLPRLYSIAATGNRIYGAGRDGDFTIHSFDNPTSIEEVSITRIEQDSLYVAPQDHFVYSGRQDNFVKIDVSDEQNPTIVGEGTLGRDHPDHGQVTPLGNWVFIGNDHGSGSAFFCHAESDDLPPAAHAIFPKDGSTFQDPRSAITIVFSDFVDTTTIGPSTIAIRASGGQPLDGIYTYNFNTVSFTPDAPFSPNTTFEVAIADGGVRDVMGNAFQGERITRFSTGDAIVVAPPPPPPSSGGEAGASANGGAAGAPSGDGGTGPGGTGSQAGGTSPVGPSAGSQPANGPSAVPDGSSDDTGCTCRVAAPPGSSIVRPLGLVAAVLGLGALRRRRRRFRRPDG